MDLNINDDMFTNYRNEAFSRGGNYILQKLFKFTSLVLGILLILLITYDLADKIYKKYNEKDKFDSNWENFRVLQNEESKQISSEIIESNNQTSITNFNKTELEEFIKEHEKLKNKISNFLELVDKHTYKGKWNMKDKFDYLNNRTEGEIAFRIERLLSYSQVDPQKIFVVFRLLDGHFIDRWTLVRSIDSPLSNVTITNSSITQTFKSYVDLGEIFERVNSVGNISAECKSTISLDWSKGNNTDKSIHNMNGSFQSNCGFGNINFTLESESQNEDYSKVMLYSIIVTLLATSQIFNTIWLTIKIANSQTYANGISMLTILQNIVWNAYGCLCHFFLTVNYDFYSLQFGIPAFLYFANFSIFELKLLYCIWRIKNSRFVNDPVVLRKKLLQFYFIFYVIMFFSLFYVMKFYFEKPYIFTAILFTWIPQIISNAISKNRISMPVVNIFLFSLNRVFLPFYYRGCPENFFQLSSDSSFILSCISILFLEVSFIYSQTVVGPRWFLPKSWSSTGFNFYKSKSEILLIRPDAEYHDCVICLFSLMNSENIKHFSEDFLAAGEQYECKNRIYKLMGKMWYYFTEFHEYEYNVNKKPFMMTPCRHYFHTQCLESWFKQKKECPSCRQDIDDTLF